MDTKLTLRLNQDIIERAKKYAAEKKLSLSKIIEFYLQALTSESKSKEIEISPFVRSIASGKSLPADLDSKEEYAEHLLEKYK